MRTLQLPVYRSVLGDRTWNLGRPARHPLSPGDPVGARGVTALTVTPTAVPVGWPSPRRSACLLSSPSSEPPPPTATGPPKRMASAPLGGRPGPARPRCNDPWSDAARARSTRQQVVIHKPSSQQQFAHALQGPARMARPPPTSASQRGAASPPLPARRATLVWERGPRRVARHGCTAGEAPCVPRRPPAAPRLALREWAQRG